MRLFRRFVLCIYCFGLACSFADTDTGFQGITLVTKSQTTRLPWRYTGKSAKEKNLLPSDAAGLFSTRGIRLELIRNHHNSAFQRIPFMQKSWNRFFFRFDSGVENNPNSAAVSFLSCTITSPKEETNRPSLLRFSINRLGSGPVRLSISIQLSEDTAYNDICRIPIKEKQIYCFENSLNFIQQDSIAVRFFLDGHEKWNKRYRYLFIPDSLSWVLTTDYSEGGYIKWALTFDGITVSQDRTYTLPPKPGLCRDSIRNNSAMLSCDSFKSNYFDENLRQVRWKLFPKSSPDFPLYDIILSDPAKFSRENLPFPLDSGDYQWQLAWQNNFGYWGAWSTPKELRIANQRSLEVKVRDVYFTDKKKSTPRHDIAAGQWYDLHLHLERNCTWDSLTYALVWLNDMQYTFGNPENKGGKFFANHNAIYNISLFNGSNLFEKRTEGAMTTTALMPDSTGLLMDHSKDLLLIDTAGNHIRLRVRVHPKAQPGVWQLTALVKTLGGLDSENNQIEHQSNIFRSPIRILQQKQSVLRTNIFLIVLCPATLLLSFWVIRRRKDRQSALSFEMEGTEADFSRILNYIRENMQGEITPKSIQASLKISKDSFYHIMRKNHATLPLLVNQTRINRAKELLLMPQHSLSDITTIVGFSDPTYFSNVFKKLTGTTPGNYQKSRKS